MITLADCMVGFTMPKSIGMRGMLGVIVQDFTTSSESDLAVRSHVFPATSGERSSLMESIGIILAVKVGEIQELLFIVTLIAGMKILNSIDTLT